MSITIVDVKGAGCVTEGDYRTETAFADLSIMGPDRRPVYYSRFKLAKVGTFAGELDYIGGRDRTMVQLTVAFVSDTINRFVNWVDMGDVSRKSYLAGLPLSAQLDLIRLGTQYSQVLRQEGLEALRVTQGATRDEVKNMLELLDEGKQAERVSAIIAKWFQDRPDPTATLPFWPRSFYARCLSRAAADASERKVQMAISLYTASQPSETLLGHVLADLQTSNDKCVYWRILELYPTGATRASWLEAFAKRALGVV